MALPLIRFEQLYYPYICWYVVITSLLALELLGAKKPELKARIFLLSYLRTSLTEQYKACEWSALQTQFLWVVFACFCRYRSLS